MNIRVDLNTNIADGSEVVFRSPADCSQVTGLAIYHHGGKTEFAFADAHGNNVGDIDHLFAENAVVKVILDVTSSMAFVQNADTNAYIERTFVKTVNGQAPDEKGNVEVKIPTNSGGCLLTTETITIGEVGNIPVTGIELDYSTMSIKVGENFQLAATVLPSNATNNVVKWKTSDSAIATCVEGYVTAVSSGSVTITAYSAENNAIIATCVVSVAEEAVSKTRIYFDDLAPVKTNTILKADGVTETNSNHYSYFKLPYYEGMKVSTYFNKSIHTAYPPFMVIEGDKVTPLLGERSELVEGDVLGKYEITLTGYSSNAFVYVQAFRYGNYFDIQYYEFVEEITAKPKIYFDDLTPVKTDTILKSDGVTEYTSDYYAYFKLLYSDGMKISTYHNKSVDIAYPPFVVVDGSNVTPLQGERTIVEDPLCKYEITLTGFSSNAFVYVNAFRRYEKDSDIQYYVEGGKS